jgi:hypothetical protein
MKAMARVGWWLTSAASVESRLTFGNADIPGGAGQQIKKSSP